LEWNLRYYSPTSNPTPVSAKELNWEVDSDQEREPRT